MIAAMNPEASLAAAYVVALCVLAFYLRSRYRDSGMRMCAELAGAVFRGDLVRIRSRIEARKRALRQGELAERIFELGRRRRVSRPELYVHPKARVVSASALWGDSGVVILSSRLVDGLGRREIDALAARQVCYREWPLIVVQLVLAGTAVLGIWWQIWWPYFAVVVASLLWFRERDAAADQAAVKLTGDPEALITAVARVHRLNGESAVLPPWARARAERIAARAGVDIARLDELLQLGAVPPDDTYSLARPQYEAVIDGCADR